MDFDSIALVLLGGALLGVAWMCSTGRWRRWASIAMLPAMPISAVPGLGLCLLLAGVARPLPSPFSGALYGIGLLTGVAGMVFAADRREDEMRGGPVVEVLPAGSVGAVARV